MASHSSIQPADGRIRVWDLPLRLFHWLLVVAIAVAFLSAEEGSALNQWHVLSGWVAGILIVFRLVWGFIGGEHSRFASFVKPGGIVRHVGDLLSGRPEATVGHNALGAVSVVLLIVMVGATVWTGIAIAEGGGEELHEVIGWSLLALVAVHVLAVVLMSLLTRESLVGAMIGGSKPAQRHPGARDARAPGAAAWLIAILVIAGTAYAVTRYDPQAFTLRSAESYEHKGQGGEEGAAGGGEAREREGRDHDGGGEEQE